MLLIAAYVLFVTLGNLVAWRIGVLIEQNWPVASLPIFLAMFFAILILAWPLAVRATARWADEPAE